MGPPPSRDAQKDVASSLFFICQSRRQTTDIAEIRPFYWGLHPTTPAPALVDLSSRPVLRAPSPVSCCRTTPIDTKAATIRQPYAPLFYSFYFGPALCILILPSRQSRFLFFSFSFLTCFSPRSTIVRWNRYPHDLGRPRVLLCLRRLLVLSIATFPTFVGLEISGMIGAYDMSRVMMGPGSA